MNMQAVCDARGRFLLVDIRQPGRCSDYVAFQTSKLRHQLESPGYLAPGLCLFGDNAYVNTQYMATPFPGQNNHDKDAYNFFHSQLRIRIECAFGMLVARWGILQKQIYSVNKVPALLICLCRLHNFCLNKGESQVRVNNNTAFGSYSMPGNVVEDEIYLREGGIRLKSSQDAQNVSTQFMAAGHHFQDSSEWDRRRATIEAQRSGPLPRDRLLDDIIDSSLRRPQDNLQRNRTHIMQRRTSI